MYTKRPETYSRRSAARPGRQRYIGHLVLAGIGFAFLAATGLNMLLAGAGVIHDRSEPPGLKSVLLSFLWLAARSSPSSSTPGIRGTPNCPACRTQPRAPSS
jgi:hypothetical protein